MYTKNAVADGHHEEGVARSLLQVAINQWVNRKSNENDKNNPLRIASFKESSIDLLTWAPLHRHLPCP
jgi:hypothetical protein